MNAASRAGTSAAKDVRELVAVEEQEPVLGRQDRRHRRVRAAKSAISVLTDSPWSGAKAVM